MGRERTPATKLMAFIQTLRVPSGDLAGEKMKVFPWQKRVLKRFNTVGLSFAVSMARGCGKSCFLAAVAVAYFLLFSPSGF